MRSTARPSILNAGCFASSTRLLPTSGARFFTALQSVSANGDRRDCSKAAEITEEGGAQEEEGVDEDDWFADTSGEPRRMLAVWWVCSAASLHVVSSLSTLPPRPPVVASHSSRVHPSPCIAAARCSAVSSSQLVARVDDGGEGRARPSQVSLSSPNSVHAARSVSDRLDHEPTRRAREANPLHLCSAERSIMPAHTRG